MYWAKWRPDVVLQFYTEKLIEMLRLQGSPKACVRQKIKLDVCSGCFLPYLYIMWSGEGMTTDNIDLF